MPDEHILELEIVQAGRAAARYRAEGTALHLEAVLYPDEALPFDIAILPTAHTPEGEPCRAVVLGGVSHAPRTRLKARLLGAWQRGHDPLWLVVSPVADPQAPATWEALPPARQTAVQEILQNAHPGEWRWLPAEALERTLHEAAERYHRSRESAHRRRGPAWQPPRLRRKPGFAAADQYTAAEYTFFELPYRFQEYIGQSLANDERVLYAVQRPAMHSHRHRSLLRRERLQAGVLLLTTHRLIHLAELVPPDAANIRYGFRQTLGALERLAEASLETVGDNLLLRTAWETAEGRYHFAWEFPGWVRTALEEVLGLLRGFYPVAPTRALRRATPPPPPEALPALVDPAANDPAESQRLTETFRAALADALRPHETAHAWALQPAWQRQGRTPRVLVVSNERIFTLPNAEIDLPLTALAALDYTGSILESHLTLHLHGEGENDIRIDFPYPAKHAFLACLEAAWRNMAVLPLKQPAVVQSAAA